MLRGVVAVLALLTIAVAGQPAAAIDKELLETGEMTYLQTCSNCHGLELVNQGTTFDLRKLRDKDKPRFLNSVLNGKNLMPPWRGVLDEKDLESIWVYIRANAYDSK